MHLKNIRGHEHFLFHFLNVNISTFYLSYLILTEISNPNIYPKELAFCGW